MNLDKIHPIRATLALSMWFAIIAFVAMGIEVPAALWAGASTATAFYFATAED